jgi:hypothetical protein
MEELKALQKKLVDIQKSGGGFKLSERTVVGIVQKIMTRGKIKLVHTVSGKEYVAEEKITKEILDEVKRNQGRISKIELTKILEVSSSIIDSKITTLLTKDKSLNLIEGKLITNYYLDNMCSEINEMLTNTGCVFLSDLSTRFDLSIDFFKRFLKEKSQLIKAKLYETRLLTEDYIAYQRQRIRPVLIGSTTPLQLSYVIDTFQVDELIIEDLVKSLIDSGIVKGKFSGNTFEPKIFSESQAAYVKGLLIQNNFIEYTALKNVGITKNAKEYIKDLQKKEEAFVNGVFFKEYFISSILKNNFEYIFFDNFAKSNATNLSSIFIFNLNEEDIHTLLDSIGIKPNTVLSINMNLIPCSLVDSFVDSVASKLKEEASKQYNSYVNKLKDKEKKKTEPETKKGKSKGKSKSKTKIEEDEEGEENESSFELLPGFKSEIKNLFEKCPNLEDLNDKQDTVSDLFEQFLIKKISQLYTQYVTEFIKSKSQNSNDPKNLMNQIESEFLEIKYTQKSLETLTKTLTDTNSQASLKAIIAHYCKKDALNLFKNILTYQLIHMKSKIDLNKINDPNQRKDIIQSISDPDIRDIFNSLNDSLINKNFLNFVKLLEENSKYLAVSLAFWDKKKEKLINEKYTKEWAALIDEKFKIMTKTGKKDYISITVDSCQSILLKKGIFIKLPYEIWAVGIFTNIVPEFKSSISPLNEILNLDEDAFSVRQEEAMLYVKNLNNPN